MLLSFDIRSADDQRQSVERWVHDFALLAGLPSEDFAERVVSDLLRSGAARWQDDRLISTVPHSRVGS